METPKIVDLAARCTKAAKDAQAWICANDERIRTLGKNKDNLLKDLRKQARLFQKLSRAATRKMCVGVFGPSQAGKSYLLSSLARDANGAVLCDFNGETHDFLREINPEGGKESTGLVTRFTLTHPGDYPVGYPVHVRLLTETELVKIFANTYYCDAIHKEGVDKKAIQDALAPLKERVSNQNSHITLDVMEDLHEYISNSFGDKARPVALDDVYWSTAIELAPKLNLDDRIKLYSIIWNKVDEFTDMLTELLKDLEALEHADELFCSIKALLPRASSVIDVETLGKKDFTGAEATVAVKTKTGQTYDIARKNLTAIVAELTLVMVHKPANYFDHTDLLDFPGYKARLETTNLVDYLRSDKADSAVEQFFRRGKVAYLFQRYNAERELTSLLLCNSTTDNIPGLPSAVEDWIIATHGKSPEERVNVKNALFYILTKADTIFEWGPGKKYETVWDSTLQGKFLAHFANTFSQTTRWVEKWTPTQAFNNLFLLRNVNIAWKAMMNLAAEPEGNFSEESIKDVEHKEKMREAFLSSTLVRKHFRSPETAFDELMKLNDGGIEHIKRSLEPMCDPNLKLNQITQALLKARDSLVGLLSPLYHSGSQEEELKKKKEFFLKIRKYSDNPLFRERFPELLNSLTLPIEQLSYLKDDAERRYEEYKEEFCSIALDQDSSGKEDKLDESALDLELDPDSWFGPSAQTTAASSNDVEKKRPGEKDLLSFYVECILESWSAHSHTRAENADTQSYYLFPQSSFLKMLDEFDAAIARLNIAGKIEAKFREIARFAGDEDLKTRRQASFAMSVLNNFTSWLGQNPAEQPPEKRKVNFNGKEAQVFKERPEVVGYPLLPETYDEQGHAKQWFMDWLISFYGLLMDNALGDAGSKIDLKQNALLGEILKSIKEDQG